MTGLFKITGYDESLNRRNTIHIHPSIRELITKFGLAKELLINN